MCFDDYAKKWDNDRRIKRAERIATEITNSLEINKNYTALEFGCGTGLISFNLNEQFKQITLIDSSKGMIDVVNEKIKRCNIKNMKPYHIDLTIENLGDEKFDIIYNSMVLHHIYDINQLLETFYNLLHENGTLCIVDLDEDDGNFHKISPDFDGHNGFNHETLLNLLRKNNFKDIEIRTFYYGKKLLKDEYINYSLFIVTAKK